MNPLFQMMMNNMLSRLRQFQQTIKGDPRKHVEELLRSGKVSQAQYDEAVRMANQFRNMM